MTKWGTIGHEAAELGITVTHNPIQIQWRKGPGITGSYNTVGSDDPNRGLDQSFFRAHPQPRSDGDAAQPNGEEI